MIVRLSGILESVDGNSVVLALASAGVAHELLVPTYLARRLLAGRYPDGAPGAGIGAEVTFHTLQYLEAIGQGTSFVPRTLAFGAPRERKLFELLTSVKGLGNKRAARAMAEPPAAIAAAIAKRDLKALQQLPEIGKKLAETIILELKDKIQPLALELGMPSDSDTHAGPYPDASMDQGPSLTPEAQEAVIAVAALGQTRVQAERMVHLALARNPKLTTTDEIVSAACAVRI